MRGKLLRLLSTCALIFIVSASAFAQGKQVTGKVTDAATKIGLPGVSIVAVGSTTGTTSDANGNYSFSVPEGTKSLKFSFIGYTTQTVNLTATNTVNVELQEGSNTLDEVV